MKTIAILSAITTFATIATAQPVIDGTSYTEYGDVCVLQNNNTNFGDSLTGNVAYADGSELDGGSAIISAGFLYIHLGGNLQHNYNKLEIFIDARDGGQNTILSTNPDVSFSALQRMGDDGTGNGLTFDTGFEPDFYITLTCGDNGIGTGVTSYVSYAELKSDGSGVGSYAGASDTYYYQDGDGNWIPVVETGGSEFGFRFALNNSNWSGVVSGTGEDCGIAGGAPVQTGFEFAIPLSLFDWDQEGLLIENASVCAFINAVDHNYVSNQVLGGLGGLDNLGEPRLIDFSQLAGDQFFSVGDVAAICGALPTGACCFANGECWEDLTDDNCFASRGAWGGESSVCVDCDLGGSNPCPTDVNADGIVDIEDLLELISAWGTICP